MYALITEMARTRSTEMRRDATSRRRARFVRRPAAERTETSGEFTVRRLDPIVADHEAVVRLAELDSAEPLEGEVLGAEVDGSLVAAISLDTHRVIADPFTHTAEIRSLLELRTAQVRTEQAPRPLGTRTAIRHAG